MVSDRNMTARATEGGDVYWAGGMPSSLSTVGNVLEARFGRWNFLSRRGAWFMSLEPRSMFLWQSHQRFTVFLNTYDNILRPLRRIEAE
jgi:hypothetical protein